MEINKRVVLSFSRTIRYVVVMVLLAAAVVAAQDPFLVDSRGGVEVWLEPQAPPLDGFGAAKILLRTTDPNGKFVTFFNVAIEGELVQQFVHQASPTPFIDSKMPDDWRAADSHLSMSVDMFGETVGGFTITETNDMSDPNDISSHLSLSNDEAHAVSGLGPIFMPIPTDAFWLKPAFSANEVDFAYLVVPCDVASGASDVTLRLGVLGQRIVNSDDPGGAQWGFGENPDPLELFPPTGNVPCIPEPGSVSLLGMGALMFLGLSRRRKTKIGNTERFHSNPVIRVEKRSATLLSFALLLHVLPTATAQDLEIVVAELGGVSVVSIPQPSPLPGLLATKVVLRTAPENKIITFENVKITGALHQVFVAFFDPVGVLQTPSISPPLPDILPPEWIAADSHILISRPMVGGETNGAYDRIFEVNDLSNPVDANEILPLLPQGPVMLPATCF
jgi:hypothetical protein